MRAMKTRAETAFPQELLDLSKDDPIVHQCITAYEIGHFTYPQALEQMAIALAKTNGHLKKMLLDMTILQPSPQIIMPMPAQKPKDA